MTLTPEHFEQFEQFEKASDLMDQKQFNKALTILSQLDAEIITPKPPDMVERFLRKLGKESNDADIALFKQQVQEHMGFVYFELEQYEKSRDIYQQLLIEHPNDDRISGGVFFSLWELEEYEKALNEAERFLNLQYLEDYLGIIEEMYERIEY